MNAGFFAAIAPLGRSAEPAQTQKLATDLCSLGFEPVLGPRSSLLWVEAGSPRLVLPERSGVIIGTLFRRSRDERPAPVVELDAELGQRIVATEGRHLFESFWGSYTALLELPDSGVAILRDPSGGQPVYFAAADGLNLYFSDPMLPIRPGLVDSRIDPEFVRHWLAYPHLRTARTGLSSITELMPGTLRVAGRRDKAELAWSPWTFAHASAQFTDYQQAAAALRLEARRTIPAYALGARHALLELSGGLDSSIVATVLADASVPFSSVNFATSSPDGDERRYARLAAASAASQLAELRQEQKPVDLRSLPPLTARPGLGPVLEPIHDVFSRHGQAIGADRFLSGTGGDSLFCYLNTAAPVLDSVILRGLGSAGASSRDVAELCECTIWTVARYALRKARRARRVRMWRKDDSFITPEAVAIEQETHPWLEPPPTALPGKREHIEALVSIFFFLDRITETPGIKGVHPLMAQPLLELCLRIPTWMWVKDGRNRSVARAAFADLLPREIAERQGKGRLESMCARAFAESRPALRDLLLGGILAQERLLDLSALDRFLTAPAEPRDTRHFRVFDLATLELWRRSWAAG